MRPDLTVEVDDIEYRALKRQGLLADEPRPPAAPEPASLPAAPAKKTSGPAGNKES
jgi:hypothetical protein